MTEKAEKKLKVICWIIVRKYNIHIQMGYIMIDPMLTFEQLSDNIHWLLKVGGYSKHNLYNKLNLYYGTDLYKELAKLQINNEAQFYERKFISYLDERVENFAKLVDYAKNAFDFYNKAVNSYISKMIKHNNMGEEWKTFSEALNRNEEIIWTNIILRAEENVKQGFELNDAWNKFIGENLNQAYRFFEMQKGKMYARN